jgi:hypothetical protein
MKAVSNTAVCNGEYKRSFSAMNNIMVAKQS